MKKIIIISILTTMISLTSIAQSSIQSQLSNLDLSLSYNKPIDSLIARIPAGYSQLIVRGGSNMFLAGGLIVSYPDDINIDITAHNFQFVTLKNINFLPSALAWPVNLMRKEKIKSIIIYKNWNIINSLEN
jgi:hypothetical protein